MTLWVCIMNEVRHRWSNGNGSRRLFILHPSSFILFAEEDAYDT